MTKLQVAICTFMALAALFWLISATVRIPHIFNASDWSEEEGVNAVPNALKKQSRWSALGAVSAAIATILQALDYARAFSN